MWEWTLSARRSTARPSTIYTRTHVAQPTHTAWASISSKFKFKEEPAPVCDRQGRVSSLNLKTARHSWREAHAHGAYPVHIQGARDSPLRLARKLGPGQARPGPELGGAKRCACLILIRRAQQAPVHYNARTRCVAHYTQQCTTHIIQHAAHTSST